MTRSPKRRWFRVSFSLRTLFVVVAMLACCFGWLGRNMNQVRDRDRFLETIPLHGSFAHGDGGWIKRRIPFVWTILGAKPFKMDIRIPDDKFTPAEIERIREVFPEAKVSVYTWPEPKRADLSRIHRLARHRRENTAD